MPQWARFMQSTLDSPGGVGAYTYVEGTYTPTWATRTCYLPDTGEICSRPDCGGERAPVKTDVVGCDAYEGTSVYVPQFLDSESLKLETPSAHLLDEPLRTWSTTTTAQESLGGASSGQSAPTDEPSQTEESASPTTTESGNESGTNAAIAPTAGGVVGLVAGAAVLGML